MAIYFHDSENIAGLKTKTHLKNWLKDLILEEEAKPGKISFIFTTDSFLLDLNRKYLSRDYYTDVIAFDFTENQVVAGDLYVSVQRVKENADIFGVSYMNELKRVMAHGVLHLLGYKDDTDAKKVEMRRKEDEYLKNSPDL